MDVDGFGRITGFVVGYLEAKELMNRLQRLGILGRDFHSGAAVHLFKCVINLVAQFFHDGDAGRRYTVNEQGDVEIASREHFYDMREMFANLVLAGAVLWIIRLNLDGTAVGGEQEMVSGFFMRKAHGLVAAFHHFAVMVIGLGWIIFLLSAG